LSVFLYLVWKHVKASEKISGISSFFFPCLARENELLIIHSSCGSLGKHIIVSRLLFLVPYPFSEYYLSQDRKNTVEFYGLVLFPKTFLISLAESWSCMSLEKHIWFGLQPVYCTAHFFCLAFFFWSRRYCICYPKKEPYRWQPCELLHGFTLPWS